MFSLLLVAIPVSHGTASLLQAEQHPPSGPMEQLTYSIKYHHLQFGIRILHFISEARSQPQRRTAGFFGTLGILQFDRLTAVVPIAFSASQFHSNSPRIPTSGRKMKRAQVALADGNIFH